MAPGLSLTGVRLVILHHATGFPVLRALFLVYMLSPLPRRSDWDVALLKYFPNRVSLPRMGDRVGLRIVLFEDCSAFTRVTACTHAEPPLVILYIEGFSHYRYLNDCSDCFRREHFAGWDLHPRKSAAFARRTPNSRPEFMCLKSDKMHQ